MRRGRRRTNGGISRHAVSRLMQYGIKRKDVARKLLKEAVRNAKANGDFPDNSNNTFIDIPSEIRSEYSVKEKIFLVVNKKTVVTVEHSTEKKR